MYSTRKNRGRPHTNRPKIDKGTVELQQKREKLEKEGKDVSLAASYLGILYAHQLISRPLYEAGCFFGELGYRYKPCLGYTFRHHAHALVPKLERGFLVEKESLFSETQEEKRTKAWRRALDILQQAGPNPYKVVLMVVFCERDFYTEEPLTPPLPEIKALRKGLGQLDLYFKGRLKDRKDKPHGPALGLVQPTRIPPFLREPQLPAPP